MAGARSASATSSGCTCHCWCQQPRHMAGVRRRPPCWCHNIIIIKTVHVKNSLLEHTTRHGHCIKHGARRGDHTQSCCSAVDGTPELRLDSVTSLIFSWRSYCDGYWGAGVV
jgi:hypothetical protein